MGCAVHERAEDPCLPPCVRQKPERRAQGGVWRVHASPLRDGGPPRRVLPSQGEPTLSAQIKAASAECLGPPLDSSTKNITKSLASLVEITEDGVGFSVRDLYPRDKVSRTVSLPTRGSTL